MTQINKIKIENLAEFKDTTLISHPDYAINRGVEVATAIGRVMKTGEPYRFMENRIVRVLRGVIRFSINLREYRIAEGEALYVGQNSVAEILDYDANSVVDLLGFTLSAENENIKEEYLVGRENEPWMEEYFRLIYTVSATLPFDRRSVEHLLLSLHYRIVDSTASSHHPKGRREELFRLFIEQLNTHRGKHDLSFYAERMNISPQYLSRLVFEASGIVASDWINRAVTLQAKLLLRSAGHTIEQIAEELNFSTTPYFCRFFKRGVGITPT
ncbi:MAG: helix-turn-helix transcriptional regulator, partial [Rikenellaceae bacterium]|nr:helix-turn-helix transcriptional regulator [Rikenellaceae bacterium]